MYHKQLIDKSFIPSMKLKEDLKHYTLNGNKSFVNSRFPQVSFRSLNRTLFGFQIHIQIDNLKDVQRFVLVSHEDCI